MVLLKVGKNRVVALTGSDMEKGLFGTDGTTPNESQTGLVSQSTSTLENLTVEVADKQLTITHNLNSVTGNGTTYEEYGNRMEAGSTLFNRVVFTPLAKNSSEEFQTVTVVNMI